MKVNKKGKGRDTRLSLLMNLGLGLLGTGYDWFFFVSLTYAGHRRNGGEGSE